MVLAEMAFAGQEASRAALTAEVDTHKNLVEPELGGIPAVGLEVALEERI